MSVERNPKVTIGRTESDHVSISVTGRMHNNATDYWDGNWLLTPIVVSVGGFSADVGANLRAEEFEFFRMGIKNVYESLVGKAQLVSMEEWISLRLEVVSGGKIVVSGVLKDRLGSKNRLTFEIVDIDQSDLPAVLDSLDEVCSRYPAIGTPV